MVETLMSFLLLLFDVFKSTIVFILKCNQTEATLGL